ncbi:MAG TPA: DUF4349 domain-containing protein [Armatimonadota bacterium]|nr:DUF4349 domain-containing protein [Armatimonadota bacterium]
MTSESDMKGPSGVRAWVLLVVLGGLVLVLALAIGGQRGKSAQLARMASGEFVPGVGMIDAETGKPQKMGEDAAFKVGGRAGGGARGGGGRAMTAEPDLGAGFEARAASYSSAGVAPMLIRTGGLRLRVEDVTKAHEEAARIVREANGYIANTSLSSEHGPTRATMTLRLPAEGLDSVMDRIAGLGRLLSKEIGTQEVTEEYVDLSSRKRNLEREEERLLDLLKRAGKVTDLLEVEQHLGRVRGQAEQITGRMRYLENRVSLSTLNVQLEGPEPKPSVGGPVWTAKDEYRQAMRSLRDTGRGLATMGIWLGVYAPVWAPILLVMIWLARRAFPRPEESQAAGK